MIIISSGSTDTINIANGESLTVTSNRTATVTAVSGLGVVAGVLGTVNGTSTFGPYSAGVITIRANGIDCIYSINPVVSANFNAAGTALVNPVNGTYIVSSIRDRIRAKRPKLMSIGNSINSLNQIASGRSWNANSPLMWIQAITGAAFDRCRSSPMNWGAQGNTGGNETLDELGCYSWGGATLANGVYNLLPRLKSVFSRMTDAPDIIYLSALVENDLAGAAPSGSALVGYIKQTIEVCLSAYPNALIILSAPGPSTSYTTAVQHTAFTYVTSWCYGVNSIYENVLCETNQAYALNGTDQPILGYMQGSTGPHPNELGALARAKAFIAQFSSLFANPLPMPTADNTYGFYQFNPQFTKKGNPGTVPAGNASIYTGHDFYTDTNIGANLTDLVGGGFNAVLTATGAVTSNTGVGPTSDATATAVIDSNIYMGVARVRIVNPTNLFTIATNLNFSGGVGATSSAAIFNTGTVSLHPEGLSGLIKAGDTFTFTTPPVLPPVGATSIAYMQLKIGVTTTIPAGVAGANNPSVDILYMNAIQVDNHLPSAPAVGASPYSYQNNTSGKQQVFLSGGTVSVYQFSRDGGITLFTALPTTGGVVMLSPGDIVKMTYTVAPTMTVVQTP